MTKAFLATVILRDNQCTVNKIFSFHRKMRLCFWANDNLDNKPPFAFIAFVQVSAANQQHMWAGWWCKWRFPLLVLHWEEWVLCAPRNVPRWITLTLLFGFVFWKQTDQGFKSLLYSICLSGFLLDLVNGEMAVQLGIIWFNTRPNQQKSRSNKGNS